MRSQAPRAAPAAGTVRELAFAGALVAVGAFLRLWRLEHMEFKVDERGWLDLGIRILRERPWATAAAWPQVGERSSGGLSIPPLADWLFAAFWALTHHPVGVAACIALLNVASLPPLVPVGQAGPRPRPGAPRPRVDGRLAVRRALQPQALAGRAAPPRARASPLVLRVAPGARSPLARRLGLPRRDAAGLAAPPDRTGPHRHHPRAARRAATDGPEASGAAMAPAPRRAGRRPRARCARLLHRAIREVPPVPAGQRVRRRREERVADAGVPLDPGIHRRPHVARVQLRRRLRGVPLPIGGGRSGVGDRARRELRLRRADGGAGPHPRRVRLAAPSCARTGDGARRGGCSSSSSPCFAYTSTPTTCSSSPPCRRCS